MVTRERSLENFKNALSELVGSKYILAEKKISEVLKVVASSQMLYELFEHITEGFDYAGYKSVCFTDLSGGKGVFTLPRTDGDALAFVFLLFVEIDERRVNFLKLLEKYFYKDGSKQASFSTFVTMVVIPFQAAAERACEKIICGDGLEEEIISAPPEVAAEEEPQEPEKPKASDATEKYISLRIDEVKENGKLTEEQKEELCFALTRLRDCLSLGDEEGAATAFLALKYMAKSIKKAKLSADELSAVIARK
ncbi:MAG: hypothetical protein IJS67_04555 [Clostridia bacterium]|nr:hypothetical protein [Clostridia bacterium]